LGYPGAFKKGQRHSPATEFKPGHRLTDEQKRRQADGMRRFSLLHPDKVRERGSKIHLWAVSNPDQVEARNRKVSETKRNKFNKVAGL